MWKRYFISLSCFLFFISMFCGRCLSETASWYGGGEKLNEYTASGERFNPNVLTCASYAYPFGTLVRVTNLENNKGIEVRVNDRGPNKRLGRAIDLTREAFSRIADLKQGLLQVQIEVVK